MIILDWCGHPSDEGQAPDNDKNKNKIQIAGQNHTRLIIFELLDNLLFDNIYNKMVNYLKHSACLI